MKKPCETGNDSGSVFEKIIGFGENSVHKSYYPELQEKITNLKKTEEELRQIKNELEARVAERTRELEAAREIRKFESDSRETRPIKTLRRYFSDNSSSTLNF